MGRKIRVLHIFAPNFRQRFGGPIFNWKYYFERWDDPTVTHHVLDSVSHAILQAWDALDFSYTGRQTMLSVLHRAAWVVTLPIDILRLRNQYDLIHVHVLWWATLCLGPVARLLGIPILYESVLMAEDTPGGLLKSRWGWLKVKLLKQFSAILAISPSLARDYLQHGFSQDQVHALMNCLDTDLFQPVSSRLEKESVRTELGLPLHAQILLFIGSIVERKGIDILVRAFVQASRKNDALYLLMVGPRTRDENPTIDDQFVESIEAVIHNAGLAGRIQFLGLVQDRARLAGLYRAADLFVFPSRNEGLPNVVLEAMACGLPVLTAKLPGLESVIVDGANGRFLLDGGPEVLEKEMLAITGDFHGISHLGQNARQTILGQHGFAGWQARIVDIYKGVGSSCRNL